MWSKRVFLKPIIAVSIFSLACLTAPDSIKVLTIATEEPLTSKKNGRSRMLDRLKGSKPDSPFDLLVVGGGATGVGCALDAASRGLKVALVERDDFASGRSINS